MYSTEGGWLHLSPEQLVTQSVEAQAPRIQGVKIKVGRPHVSEDMARLTAVREAVGDAFEIMIDANQCFTVGEAIRRARHYETLDIAWFEEPLCLQKIWAVTSGWRRAPVCRLRWANRSTACNISANICSAAPARSSRLRPTSRASAASRPGSSAHVAESFNVPICPHFLMELHVGLCAAMPNAPWVEYIPQLDSVTLGEGCGMASEAVLRFRQHNRGSGLSGIGRPLNGWPYAGRPWVATRAC